MNEINERIWRLNQEYVRRLSSARTILGLLGSLLVVNHNRLSLDTAWGAAVEEWLRLLNDANDALNQLYDDHRAWRYTYLYETPETKRVVRDQASVARAVVYFEHLLHAYDPRLETIAALLHMLPRPDPALTTVPQGDLWALFASAVADLRAFSQEINWL